jgi:hypothetical protein
MKKVIDLLKIPIDGAKIPLFTKYPSYNSIADRYQRVVIGQRGPYVEFTKNQIIDSLLYIPRNQLYRLSDPKVFYIEFRTVEQNVKVYYQMRSVSYADYLINHFYISPADLFKEDGTCCLLSQLDVSKNSEEFFDFEVK